MRKVSVVIGANYGDEGKGLVTDYLTDPNTVVVRFNGGAQAGHTVVTPDGKRHVFHHFGSGELNGGYTFLSKYFVVSPMFYMTELLELRNLGCKSNLGAFIDSTCFVTTPYDIMINQAVEESRGIQRHGSCGMGMNETITRCYALGKSLMFSDLENTTMLEKKLKAIREEYVSRRMKDLGIEHKLPYLMDDGLLSRFMQDCQEMVKNSTITTLSDMAKNKQNFNFVFEGAQGLQLDQNSPNFPHVTRSNTGMENVAALLRDNGLEKEDVQVYYVTRTYFTRHGAGPLNHEVRDLPYSKVVDETNIHNKYQGSLRFAWMNLDLLVDTIKVDLKHGREFNVSTNLVVTCADQLDGDIQVVNQDTLSQMPLFEFLGRVVDRIGAKQVFVSHGRTRQDVTLAAKEPAYV